MESRREEYLKTKAVLLLFRAHSNLFSGREAGTCHMIENLVSTIANGFFFPIV